MNAYKWGVAFFVSAGIVGVVAVICFFFNTVSAVILLLAAGLLCWAGVECFKAVAKAYREQQHLKEMVDAELASAEDEEADADADAADADLEDEEDD